MITASRIDYLRIAAIILNINDKINSSSMAHIFKQKTLIEKLKDYQIPDFQEKLKIVQNWLQAYQSGQLQNKTESECEQAFNQDFFVNILGYTAFPAQNYTLEPKGKTEKDSQKPDAVLGCFFDDKRTVSAVVEIKDANTSLDKSQKREGNLSPIAQAFKYQHKFKACPFVIATNFFEIKLLKDKEHDFEEFNLETLANPKDDYQEFKKFHFLLNAQNFTTKKGQSKTEQLLTDIRIEQEKVSKEFYGKYKDLRWELIKNIEKNNPATSKELIIEKAQKIIDRIVFIAFCEDRDLLPEHTLHKALESQESSSVRIPVWEFLKALFNSIDKGDKEKEIPEYNGGLFAEDRDINVLKIDDDICKKFAQLGNYDFTEGGELDVNILGHIFEQSISDIEEIKNYLLTEDGGFLLQENGDKILLENSGLAKKAGKRKKDGIFYTPDYIVDYIVKNSLGKYLEEKEAEILKKHNLKENIKDKTYQKRFKNAYKEYQNVLRAVKVLDPACGSGAFLVKIYDFLLEENKRVAKLLQGDTGQTDFFSSEDYIKGILENNIFGVDINPESVEITKLSLWLKTAQKGKKLVNLSGNIKCGNSLIDDPEVAGKKAFKWEEEFSEIMKDGGFDVVVGNPPYVGSRNIPFKEKKYFENNFKTAKDQYDLYILFMEKSLKLLKDRGSFSFIVPNKFIITNYGKGIRNLIYEKATFVNFRDCSQDNVFEDASVYPIIFVFKKDNNKVIDKVMGLKIKEGSHNWLNEFISKKASPVFSKIEAVQGDQAVKLKVWRPLASSGKIIDGNESIISNHEINRYLIEESRKGSLTVFRDYDLKKNKIILKKLCYNIEAGLDDKGMWPINTTYCLTSDDANSKFVLAILNSSLISYYARKKYLYTALRGGYIELRVYQVEQIPVPKVSLDVQQPFIQKADLMLKLNKELHDKKQKFFKLLQHEFGLEKISKKLEKFYELDFDEFVKALKIKKLSLDQKGELMDFFEKNKQEAAMLAQEIEKTDSEIDEMVFELYGLNKEEKKIIMEGGSEG